MSDFDVRKGIVFYEMYRKLNEETFKEEVELKMEEGTILFKRKGEVFASLCYENGLFFFKEKVMISDEMFDSRIIINIQSEVKRYINAKLS